MDRAKPDPLEGASKAERRAWSKKNQAKAVRVWSSTNVRYLLGQGRIKDADAILGHPHAVEGAVVHGEERGRTIGFPTAQGASEGVSQQFDSSSVDARLADHSPYRWPAAISIGTKPTFNEVTGMNDRVVEAYAVTDDWLDLYDHQVRVEFVGFLRPQIKFDSAQDLIDELKRNVEETKRITA